MSRPDFSLAGETAVVTGGSRGIGKAIAVVLAEAGADVIVCSSSTRSGELEAAADEIQRLGRRSLAVRADISKKADVNALVEQVIEKFSKIDILVNNAGIPTNHQFWRPARKTGTGFLISI
jgi:NAD(P)-dependent dehydrogenase (short-subunit alcohol dehydrogenase family)